MAIETVSGGVITSGSGSMDIGVFYRRTPSDQEVPMFQAERDKNSGVKGLNSLNIVQSGLKRHNKFWSTRRCSYPDGSIIKLLVTRRGKSPMDYGMTSIIIQPRDTGPLMRVSIDLPQDANSNMSVAHIEGRFDVLTPKQVKDLGMSKSFAGASELTTLYDPEDEDSFIRIHKLENEVVAMTTQKIKIVKTPKSTGGKVLLKQRRVRHIRPT